MTRIWDFTSKEKDKTKEINILHRAMYNIISLLSIKQVIAIEEDWLKIRNNADNDVVDAIAACFTFFG